jgi:hypothetical protein
MYSSRLARRRFRLGAALVGLCVVAGSVGTAALADSGSGSGSSVSIDASVMVQAGMNPIDARQAAAKLNAAIDSSAQSMARAATGALPPRGTLRSTAAATTAFTNEVRAALVDFVKQSVPALKGAGAATDAMLAGTLAVLAQIAQDAPGALGVTVAAEVAVAGGSNGTTANASVTANVDPAIRKMISDSVHGLQPLLPLTRATLQNVALQVRKVVDASIVAVDRIFQATVDLVRAVVTTTSASLQAVCSVAQSAVAATKTIVAAVDSTLDNLSDLNISAQVDASLHVSAH